jgi:hypothetical protein
MIQVITLVGGPLDGQEVAYDADIDVEAPPLVRAYQMAEGGEVVVQAIDYWRTDTCTDHGTRIYQYTP